MALLWMLRCTGQKAQSCSCLPTGTPRRNFVEETALSIQSILDGYPAETSGTLFIVQNNQVVAANRPELIGQDVAGSPLAQGIRKAGAAEKLTHTRGWNGSGCYFGMFCHGRSFDLYAYTDEKIIFREALFADPDGSGRLHPACNDPSAAAPPLRAGDGAAEKKSRRGSTRPSWRNRTASWRSRFSTRGRQTAPSGSSCSI